MRKGSTNCDFKDMTKYSKKRLRETNQEVEGDAGYELNMLAFLPALQTDRPTICHQ